MLNNLSNRTNFLMQAVGYKQLEDFTIQIVSTDTPSFTISPVNIPSGPKGIGRANIPSSTLESEPITVRFIVDRELKSYLALYRWMLRINNLQTGYNTAQIQGEQPTAIQMHVLNNIKTEIMLTFNLVSAFPSNLGPLSYSYDEEGDIVIECTCTFNFKRADLEVDGVIIKQ